MNDSTRYANCRAVGGIYGGCHDDDERAVCYELCEIVEDVVALYNSDGGTLPAATANNADALAAAVRSSVF